MSMNRVLVNCARSAICTELYRVGMDRIDQRIAAWMSDPATTQPDAGHWTADLRSGAVSIAFAETALHLSARLTDLPVDDPDLQALAAIFNPQERRPFPCIDTVALCERLGTHGTDTETDQDFLQAVVAAEAAASLDYFRKPVSPAHDLDREHEEASR